MAQKKGNIEGVDVNLPPSLSYTYILLGINLLREGLDLPEVALVGIMDADKEEFLRSERSLIQTIGRAARNQYGRVILYAYKSTKSMQKAMETTAYRREKQEAYNKKHGITPKTVEKKISGGVIEVLRGTKGKGKAKMRDEIKELTDFRFQL